MKDIMFSFQKADIQKARLSLRGRIQSSGFLQLTTCLIYPIRFFKGVLYLNKTFPFFSLRFPLIIIGSINKEIIKITKLNKPQ